MMIVNNFRFCQRCFFFPTSTKLFEAFLARTKTYLLWRLEIWIDGSLIRGMSWLPFARTWVHPQFLVGFVLLIFLVFCVVLSFCVLFVFALCLVYPMFPVSLVCQFLIDTSVRSNVYLQHLDLWKHILWKCRYLVTGTWRISGITFTRYLKGRKNGNTLKVIESKKTKGHTQDSQIRYRYSSHGCKFDILKTTPKDKHRYSFTPISCLIL
jgi:hypothetical protein